MPPTSVTEGGRNKKRLVPSRNRKIFKVLLPTTHLLLSQGILRKQTRLLFCSVSFSGLRKPDNVLIQLSSNITSVCRFQESLGLAPTLVETSDKDNLCSNFSKLVETQIILSGLFVYFGPEHHVFLKAFDWNGL